MYAISLIQKGWLTCVTLNLKKNNYYNNVYTDYTHRLIYML